MVAALLDALAEGGAGADLPVCYPHGHGFQQLLVGNCIEVSFQVRVVHFTVAVVQMSSNRIDRLVGGLARPEAERRVEEIGLEDRLQHQHRHRRIDFYGL